jgi:protein-S-isoprenylcysteine O-methyltransferase Ste14
MRRSAAAIGSALFFIVAPGTVAFLVPWTFSRWHVGEPFWGITVLRAVGLIVIVLGLAIVLDSFVRFVVQGIGTPAPILPTKHLVVTGFYRYVRNPMYIGVASLIFGQALLFGNARVLIYGIFIWLAFHLFVLAYEEPTLKRQFGREYAAFTANVPRWIPRLRPWRGSGLS